MGTCETCLKEVGEVTIKHLELTRAPCLGRPESGGSHSGFPYRDRSGSTRGWDVPDGTPDTFSHECATRRGEMLSSPSSGIGGHHSSHHGHSHLNKKKMNGVIMKGINKYGHANICFVCDMTDSMCSHFDVMKKNIESMIAYIKEKHCLEQRVTFIGFREYGEKYEKVDFGSNVANFLSKMEGMRCDGGGDTCEDVIGGLLQMFSLKWSSAYKLVYLIMDAHNHGQKYHALGARYKDEAYASDYYRLPVISEVSGIEYMRNLEDTVKLMSNTGYHLIVLKCDPDVERMIEITKSCHNSTGRLREFMEYDSNGCDSDFIDEFCRPCTESFSDRFSSSGLWIEDTPVNWNIGSHFNFVRYQVTLNRKWDPYSEQIPSVSVVPDGEERMFLADTPPRSGAFKLCYALGSESQHYAAKKLKDMQWMKVGDAIDGLLPSIVAGQLAAVFNSKCAGFPGFVTITFTDMSIMQFAKTNKSGGVFKQGEFFTTECMLDGPYRKYSNNHGYLPMAIRNATEFKIAQAYSHFTYDYSEGAIIVVDIKGIATDKGLYFIDPAVHSCQRLYGATDLSFEGMKAFFGTHDCNDFCRQLGLESLKEKVRAANLEEDMSIFQEEEDEGHSHPSVKYDYDPTEDKE